MSFSSKNTSLITILSSEHGRLRREQRDIDKRDLQRALKYGRRERAWGQRWQVDYDGITYITDSTMRKEITAFPSPLPTVPYDALMENEHAKAKSLFRQMPDLVTSHTVVVIDNSGSMLAKKNDVHLYRDSQNASVSMTALEFVAEQVLNGTAANSDLFSLIKFSESPTVEIEMEPIGWPVYNKILGHRNKDKYVNRQFAPSSDEIYGHSNYIPALDKVKELLESGYHERCALSVFFFSDGQPTDHSKLYISREESYQRMQEKITQMASLFGEALTVTMVRLGNRYDDFRPLREMADAASSSGSKGSFERCERTAKSISSAISSTVTSTAETRTALQEGRRTGYTQRSDLMSETDSFPKFNWQYFRIGNHLYYDPRIKKFVPTSMLPLAAFSSASPEEAMRRRNSPPPFLAINHNFLGKGAERVAFRCCLSDEGRSTGFVFDTMIAKETKDVERIDEKIEFHEGFAETQDLASYLASEFNKLLKGLPDYSPTETPVLSFLSCSVLLLEDPNWPTGLRGVLVEKMLDTDRFRWTKWNDNNGMVDGKRKHMDVDVDFELKQLQKQSKNLGAIVEEEESDDEESLSDIESADNDEEEMFQLDGNAHGVDPSEYLQAFTHFTHRYTNKRVMVCDLQGVFNTDTVPPTIELTDPAIHYASTKGRRMVYGRTDKGRSGMNTFFRTHNCTKICKFLQLSAKNKKWKNNWRNESSQNTNFRRY